MNLIKNKKSSALSSATNLNLHKKVQSSLLKQNVTGSNYRAETERNNQIGNSQLKQQTQKSGLIARALSSTRSLLSNLVSPSKQSESSHIIGNKYIYHDADMVGKGYSSQVYKGSLISNPQSKNFAIKILDLTKIKGFLYELLKMEISIHKNLNHQNIVKCYDIIQTKQKIYLILQYCSGGDLSEYIKKKKITQKQALSIMNQVVEGCKYLVKEKILHRDLKPCNIFKCGKKKIWKIGDFGFSCKSTDQIEDVNVGTPIYMPPQSLQNSLYSHKSDFFALGIMMYQMVFGKVPWFSKSQSLLITKMKGIKLEFNGGDKSPVNNSLIIKFITRCCQIPLESRISEQQFLKVQLYPKDALKLEQEKKRNKKSPTSKNKILTGNSKSNQKKMIVAKPQKQKQKIHVNKNQNKVNQKNVQNIKQKEKLNENLKQMNKGKQKQKDVVQVNLSSVPSKTSESSTQPQTRVLAQPSTNNLVLNQSYKTNNEILYKQIQFCKHLYYMIKNMKHFYLDSDKKQHLIIVIYKHIVYLLKKLKNTKFNHFQLKKWDTYKESKFYSAINKEVTMDLDLIEKQYLKYLKHKDIKLLRQINSKFPELSNDIEFNMKFYQKITSWLKTLIHQFTTTAEKVIENQIQTTHTRIICDQKKNQKQCNNLKQNCKRCSKSKQKSLQKKFLKNSLHSTNKKSTTHSMNEMSPIQKSINHKTDNYSQTNKYKQSDIKTINKEPQDQNQIHADMNKNTMNTGQKIKAKAMKSIQQSPKLVYNGMDLISQNKQNKQKIQVQEIQNQDKIIQTYVAYQQNGKDEKIQSRTQQLMSIDRQQKYQSQTNFSKQLKFENKQVSNEENITQQQIHIINPILIDQQNNSANLNSNFVQPFEEPYFQKIPHSSLLALQSLFQYYILMESKIILNQDIHTSFSVINLHQHYDDENILTLVRDYQKAKFNQEDALRVRNLTRFL